MLQVSVTDLSPAGPIQAVEIQVESSSLANMCRAHHAIIRRMQVPAGAGVGEGGTEVSRGSPMDPHNCRQHGALPPPRKVHS